MMIGNIQIDRLTLERRRDPGDVKPLAASMADIGQRAPIVIWQGHVIDGERRVLAAILNGAEYIAARWVDSLEEACAAIKENQREDLPGTKPMNWTERGHLFAILNKLDEPDARKRRSTNGGVPGNLSRKGPPLAGMPGFRSWFTHCIGLCFDLSEQTITRFMRVYRVACGMSPDLTAEQIARGEALLDQITNNRITITAAYNQLNTPPPPPLRLTPAAVKSVNGPLKAEHDRISHNLSTMVGLTAGLADLPISVGHDPDDLMVWRQQIVGIRNDLLALHKKLKETTA